MSGEYVVVSDPNAVSFTDTGFIEATGPVVQEALRYNQGKTQYSYIDLTCFQYTAQVLEFGAVKYDRDNWRKGMQTSKILDSLLRHIAAIQRGEVVDPESGLPHIGHIGCNVMFLGNDKNTQDIQVLPTK
jgi:hypothetical protein